MTTIFVAESYGRDLSSRGRASELRCLIEQRQVAELDFANVRTISESFADELFGVLVEAHGDEWFRQHVRVANLGALLRTTILEAVARRLHELV